MPLPGSSGLFVADRSSSASVTPYWNDTAQTAQSGTSSAPASTDIIIGANYTASTGTAQTLSEAHIGASLAPTLELALYNRLHAYMTAVGVP